MDGLKPILKLVVEQGATLSREQARQVLSEVLASESGDGDLEIAALLTAMATRGETAEELTGFAEAMRALATPVPLSDTERAALVDTCGTGGDGLGTFNISTGAALVAVAAGAKVAKHGNRAVTSKCGSADVLEALGVPVTLSPDQAAECLRATGFMFLLAPSLHPAMKRVMPIRRALGFRTIFNLAGPLTNPAGAQAQVMGVYSAQKLPIVAESMARLGVRHAFVAHGSDGLDEITVTGGTDLAEVRSVGERGQGVGGSVRLFALGLDEMGFSRASLSDLAGGGTAQENAAILLGIFAGELGPKRDIVLLNAAAALVVAGVASDFQDGVARGAAAIDSGAVRTVVQRLAKFGKET
ncbi:anthranilate phosphoribosyltransferase [Silvibacterium bohemicum]|uniref:Anthranilate phosphoribosyltransferase n=1 Tax=Silvibacterium bohemicum TaxID=1577686 RepID=A0A841JXN7_9BACT|nr:anthranilate phosphoribosyltransferase [Silvibacterium bohemicum]MBB6146183.1 anthranilate phosphoribosyltransferase [Silvibacterium bohemicum]